MTHDTHAYAVWVIVLTALTAQIFHEVGWPPALGGLVGLVVSMSLFAALIALTEEKDDRS